MASSRVAEIADEIAPRSTGSTVEESEEPALVVVTPRWPRRALDAREGRVLRGLEAMAEEADAIQALGPYAVEDTLRAMSESESNAARDAIARTTRLLARFAWAWGEERGGQPEQAQQSLPLVA